ncbi:MAG: tripartite tricarboxylate transporter permease [Deltaproteobacteria bacterium]|nr:tripartite tricarboxylate transporter permease [Deltaproteobacteria bacterium]MBM4322756.1 tripartite tricarboxylate transporter permease [Deltaproteobacteria bacterium]
MGNYLDYFLMTWVSPKLMFLVAIGTFCGIYVGAIPGLSVTMAVSILISFTFSWDINPALALMAGIYMGGVYGGSRSAILLNIPGAPAAIATSFDGYPLAKIGEAGNAIGLATVASVIGGFIGIIILALAAPIISEYSLLFAPRDYFLLAVMGILLVGSLSGESLAKGVFSGALGVLLSMVGMDSFTGQGRFTFGSVYLMSGIHYVAIMIGLFGISEALVQIHDIAVEPIKQQVNKIIPSWRLLFKHLPLIIKSGFIGVWIGALPGTGGDIAALLSYGHARRSVKKPTRPFGQGAYEGIIAPETANNAAIGGAYIPMLTLGIPGDAVTAVLIGALFIHGLKPGPMLMIETPHLFWFTVGNLLLADIFLLIFGLSGIKIFTKLVEVRKGLLLPTIIIISVVGTYAINNSISDVYWMLGFGIFGYVLKMYGFQVGPVILGVILGPLMEDNYRRAMLDVHNNIFGFFFQLVRNPLTLVLTLSIVVMIFGQAQLWTRIKTKVKRKQE